MKSKIGYVIVGIVIFIGLFVGVYKSGNSASINKEPIKIGGISALTGVGVAIGEEERKGALLAVEEINKQGGLDGHPLELISEDVSLDQIKVGISVVQKLVNVDHVVAIVGPQWDEPAGPILPIIEASHVPMIGPDSSPMLQAAHNYKYFFSTWYDNRVGIRELLRFAQAKGIKTIAIVKPLNAGFWQYTADTMNKEAVNYGIKIVDEVNMGNPISLDSDNFDSGA